MADRSSIRKYFMFFDALYDSLIVAGIGYMTYQSLRTTPRIQAPQGEVLIINRPILGQRLVEHGYRSFHFYRFGQINHVPSLSNQVIKAAMPDKDKNLLQFQYRLRLHANDPYKAADKYGSSIRSKFVNSIQNYFRTEGKNSVQSGKESDEQLQGRFQSQIRRKLESEMQDPNILKEFYFQKIIRTKVGQRVSAQVL